MSTATVENLLFAQDPKIIDSVVERRPIRLFPKTRAPLKAGDTAGFEVQLDGMVDLKSATLHFDMYNKTGAGSTDAQAAICAATDVIRQLEIFYNDATVESIRDCNAWTSAFVAQTANRAWLFGEGNALLGWTSQGTANQLNNAAAAVQGYSDAAAGVNANTAASPFTRTYAVPLALISGFCRMRNYCPMLSNKLKFSFVLETDANVLQQPTATTSFYELSNMSITVDTIIVQPAYKEKLAAIMKTPKGIRIPFTSFQTSRRACVGASRQDLQITNNNSNALSLFLMRSPEVAKVWTANNWHLSKHSFPLQNFSQLDVASGSRRFTPSDGIRTYPELYISTEKCATGPGVELSGNGWVDFPTFTGGYTQGIGIVPANFGLCLMGVNLEKAMLYDDAVANSGVTAAVDGMTNTFDVTLQTAVTAPLLATDVIYTCIVHKRALVFRDNGVQCEY